MLKELEKPIDTLQDESITIRQARPDLEEGLVFAKFFDEASEGFFSSMLGKKTFEIIANAFVKPNNPYSFEHASMIEYKSNVVGTVSGYASAEKEGFNNNILSQFPNGAKFRIMIFSLIGRLLSRILGPRGKEDYYIQTIAIRSKIRGKGLGQKLLKHCEALAIEKGAKTLSLDVSSKNEIAINSYKKFGMEIASYWPKFLKLPSVFTRMVKKLQWVGRWSATENSDKSEV